MVRPPLVLPSVLAERAISSRLLLPVFALLALAAAAPVLAVPIAPLADYINHLARMHVLAYFDQNPLLEQFFTIQWAIIPNLVMDLIVPTLDRQMDVYLAGQAFIIATMLLMVTGAHAVHYAVSRRWSPWPLVSFLFLYNNILLYGLMNYLFGLGVALWGVAAWILLRDRSPWLRGLVSAVVVAILFTCHLFAVGLYGLALLSCEAWLCLDGQIVGRRRLAGAVLAFGLPFVPVVPLMLASPTMGLVGDILWESTGKLDGLYYVFQNYSDLFDLSYAALIVAATVWAVQRRLLGLHPIGWTLLVLGVAVYMAMPRMLFGSWIADQRLPIGIVFLMIGFVRFDASSRWARYAFYAFVIGAALPRFLSVQVAWQGLERQYQDFRQSVDLIRPGSTVLVATADSPQGNDAFNIALSHAPCLALIERSSLVSTTFSVQGKQVLSVRPTWRNRVDTLDGDPPTVSQLIAATADAAPASGKIWEDWPEKFDYLYILYAEHEDNPAPDLLQLLHQGPRFQLYRVVPADEQQ
ncbi:MAG: hypothetical protein GC191_03015 [Azospirillum sp.]|nr:hypothetical protein [Azospirillum sp.]